MLREEMMAGPNHKRVKANRRPDPTSKKEVFLVENEPVVEVLMGETLDIDLDCEGGFTVFIPYAGLFEPVDGSDQIFEASEISPPDVSETIDNKLWRVSITRKKKANPYQKKVFPYCIYAPELDNFAVANSPPKMNLYP